jgi:cardiolipin synthase (CMP-forming)
MLTRLPHALILFRFLCAPAMILLAYNGGSANAGWVIALLYLGLISDILDGIVARNLGVADVQMRRLDSQTDLIFWLSVGYTSWILHPEIILAYKIPVIILFITEASCYLTSFLRFRKETCTHAWASKCFGLCMLAAFTEVIGFGIGGFFFKLALIFGYISHIDRILITLLIPEWTHDIPSTYHAYLLRQGKTFKRYKLFN